MKFRFLFFLVFFFEGTLLCFSQQYNFMTFGVEEGLPQSTVYDIFQDKERYLWIGTNGGGLCRYDGYRYKVYGKNEGLNANVVRKIVQDNSGKLWLATNEGIYVMSNGRLQSFDKIEGNRSTFFFSVYIDSRNNIWAASSGKGVYKISPAGNDYTVTAYTTANGLNSDYTLDICEDGKANIWIATYGNGLDIFNVKEGTFTNISTSDGIASDKILCIKRIGKDTLAFGTNAEGAFKINTTLFSGKVEASNYFPINGTGGKQVWSIDVDADNNCWVATYGSGVILSSGESYITLDKSKGLLDDQLLKVFMDVEKNMWIGSNGFGLFKYLGNRFVHITQKELPDLTEVSAIVKDLQGKYWMGSNGAGLYCVDHNIKGTTLIKRYTRQNGLPDNAVTGISMDKKGALWVATKKGVCKWDGKSFKLFNESNGLISDQTNCILADSKGRVWIGTPSGCSILDTNGLFVNVSESNGLVNNEVQCILEDKTANIWLGTFGGLVKFDGKELHAYFEEDGLTDKKVQSLAEDKKGKIYVGTFGGGVYRFNVADTAKKPIVQLIAGDRLLSSNIYSLTFQNDSVLLLGTDRALNRVVFTKDYTIRSINSLERQDGFKDVENSLNATFNDNGNSVWFGTTKGLTLYFPAYDKINLLKPQVRITGIKVNGSEFPLSSLVNLSSNQNSIKIDFVSISLTSPSNNKYYYKLAGLDSTWNRVIIDKQNNNEFASIEYKKLPPGTYTLQIRAYNNNGIVSSPDGELRFTIALPFYKTTAFIIGAVISLLLLFYLLLTFREKALVKEKMKLETIVKERTAEVVLQKDEIENQKKEITDSINYSKRIQNAILPEQGILFSNLPESFILYRPKDIVSGDFYYFSRSGDSFYMAVADCTGHGVPGAFMSMIGSKELEEALRACNKPGDILGKLNKNIRKTLKQNLEHGIRDGMDIALLSFTFSPGKKVSGISYSAANRPLWIIRNNSEEVEEIKATKTAIGGHTEDDQEFAQHDLDVATGDQFYIFSDGFADQFGGDSGKKIMTRKMKELLLECRHRPMHEQKQYLEEFFTGWRGDHHEQVDDVLIIGVRC